MVPLIEARGDKSFPASHASASRHEGKEAGQADELLAELAGRSNSLKRIDTGSRSSWLYHITNSRLICLRDVASSRDFRVSAISRTLFMP